LSERVKKFAKDRYGSMSGLAREMGISPQHLHAYLSGGKTWGAAFTNKLASAGFETQDVQSNSTPVVSALKLDSEEIPPIDLAGIVELTRTQFPRLAQLLGVPQELMQDWYARRSAPSPTQVARLFNLTIALALAAQSANHEKKIAESYGEQARKSA